MRSSDGLLGFVRSLGLFPLSSFMPHLNDLITRYKRHYEPSSFPVVFFYAFYNILSRPFCTAVFLFLCVSQPLSLFFRSFRPSIFPPAMDRSICGKKSESSGSIIDNHNTEGKERGKIQRNEGVKDNCNKRSMRVYFRSSLFSLSRWNQ